MKVTGRKHFYANYLNTRRCRLLALGSVNGILKFHRAPKHPDNARWYFQSPQGYWPSSVTRSLTILFFRLMPQGTINRQTWRRGKESKRLLKWIFSVYLNCPCKQQNPNQLPCDSKWLQGKQPLRSLHSFSFHWFSTPRPLEPLPTATRLPAMPRKEQPSWGSKMV